MTRWAENSSCSVGWTLPATDRNDLWAYSVDSNQWTQLSRAGQPADPRHGHTVTLDPLRRRIIVVAGQGASCFGDAWAYDIRASVWRQLSGSSQGAGVQLGRASSTLRPLRRLRREKRPNRHFSRFYI